MRESVLLVDSFSLCSLKNHISLRQSQNSFTLQVFPTTMSLKLSHCVPEDAPELAKAYVATYQPISPRYQTTYRNSPQETMLKIWEADFLKTIESQNQPSPTQQVHCLKVTDSSNGEIMAYAIWKYLPQGYKPEDDGQVVIKEIPDGANERLLRDFCKITGEIRSEHPGRREEHWCEWMVFFREYFQIRVRGSR